MEWVLIISMWFNSGYAGGAGSATAEFYDESSCHYAAQKVKEAHGWRGRDFQYVCVPKGGK